MGKLFREFMTQFKDILDVKTTSRSSVLFITDSKRKFFMICINGLIFSGCSIEAFRMFC